MGHRPKRNDLLKRFPALERDARVAAKAGLTTDAFYALPDIEQRVQFELYEADHRKHGDCGHDIEVCSDRDREWFASLNVCYPTMLKAFSDWRWDELYGDKFHDGTLKSWSTTRSAAYPYGHRDGVDIVVAATDFDPDNDFLKLKGFFGIPDESEPDEPGVGDRLGDKA